MANRTATLGVAGLRLLVSCAESELDPPELDETNFSTPQHEEAGFNAYTRTCARDVVGGQPLISIEEAVRWINDPDCIDNRCDLYDITSANPDPKKAAEDEGDRSLLWACRNPDHFSQNARDGQRSATPIITDDNFSEFRDNKDARERLIAYGIERARQARQSQSIVTRRSLMRAALRAAFRAAHYSTDRLACGHDVGNNLCDWRATSVPENSLCARFVNNAANRATTDWKTNWLGLRGAMAVCKGGTTINPVPIGRVPALLNGQLLKEFGKFPGLPDWNPTEGMGYASVERLIRHYSRGRPYTDFDPQTGAAFTRTNNCSTTCSDGECLRLPLGRNGQPDENRRIAPGSRAERLKLGDAATADIARVCSAFRAKVTPVNSGSYRRADLNGRSFTPDDLLDDTALLPADNNNVAADELVTGFAETIPTEMFLPGDADRKDPSNPLCTTQLGGRWAVRATWGEGRTENACLFFMGGPNRQVNFKLPAGIAESQVVNIEVVDESTQEVIAFEGPLLVGPVEPGLFTADSSGAGLVSGQLFRRVDGQDIYTNLTTTPINLHLEGENMILILYGTGIRGRGPNSAVRATVGGRPATVDYAGAQGLLGFDQVNLTVPTGPLIADQVEGRVGIELEIQTEDGRTWRANRVEVFLSSAPPA
jgi:uncharacterized protein (TIGR03437 family)